MKVLMLSKALVVGAYQRKLEEIARQPDIELSCIVPPAWRQYGREQHLERAFTSGYELIVEPIRFNGSFHFFYFPGLAKQLRRLRPDVVHVDEEPYNLATFLATRLAVRHRARPLFFTWQNLLRRYPPPFRWFEQDVFRQSRHAIAGNAEAAAVIRAKGFRGPVAVIPQFGVDPADFSPRAGGPDSRRAGDGASPTRPLAHSPTPSGARPFTIGYLGRLAEEKGLLVLLEAVRGLEGDWQLELYGHGPLEQELIARAAQAGLGQRVLLRAPVPSTSVPGRLRELDVLVLPSLTRPNWKEQFGRVLVEAMACGIPVIGSDSGEIPNVIGDAGVRFREGDAAALRGRLEELLRSERRRAELGARGRVRVLERFTHEKIAAATVDVYRQLMKDEG